MEIWSDGFELSRLKAVYQLYRVSLPKLGLIEYELQILALFSLANKKNLLAEKINKHCWNLHRAHFSLDTVWVAFPYAAISSLWKEVVIII